MGGAGNPGTLSGRNTAFLLGNTLDIIHDIMDTEEVESWVKEMYAIQQKIKKYSNGAVTAIFHEDESVSFSFRIGDAQIVYKAKTGEFVPSLDDDMDLSKWFSVSGCDTDGIVRAGCKFDEALHRVWQGARACQQLDWRP